MWAWGNNGDGQLGDGRLIPRRSLVRVLVPRSADVSISAGDTCLK
ncbi:RCC1 domain-containing protein [Corallococcus silvisoli]|nr:RCC1 domain-containing protein [Corallococcus silvisoli]NBD08945.1 hypothetical protein [Corallococcus silvisoli]